MEVFLLNFAVVPLVGTWIEIEKLVCENCKKVVVPLVGTWIEIYAGKKTCRALYVVPLVGTWIEIRLCLTKVR